MMGITKQKYLFNESGQCTHYKILIADDQETILQLMDLMFNEEENFKTYEAKNGRMACEITNRVKPDLILMDWIMPGMSGIEALKQIKSNEETKDIPILMFTGDTSEEKLLEALEAGAVDFIRKPIVHSELLARVRSALRGSLYNKSLQKQKDKVSIEKEKVEHYAKELERSNRDLKEFASIVSHDLKEPLRKIYVGSDELLANLSVKINEQGKNIAIKIKDTSLKMRMLIQDLLTYSNIRADESKIVQIDLGEMIKNVVSDLEVRINETKGIVSFKNLPVIYAHKLQIHQLFQNLISNALKFHREKVAPVVNIDCKTNCNGFYEMKVSDNGIGFDEKYLDRIFRPFQRLVGKSQFEGTGMGTAICQKIVERHGGTITAKSKVGEGSTFIIYIPEKAIIC